MQYLFLFIEGILTFISPCLLPMLPIYVSYFAGSGPRSIGKTLKSALGFVTGFTIIFMALGALAGTVGVFLMRYRTIVDIVLGLFIIAFGLSFLGVFNLSFFKGSSKSVNTENMGFFSAMLFGIIFSIGWTPCVGAFLGTALALAAQQAHVLEGMLMLLVYSLGLAIPFIISAILIDYLKNAFNWIKKHYNIINAISGVLLIIIGILMATGLFNRLVGMLTVQY